ncbi:hypothetical protein F2Q69_00011163 [Brassica cretica]|uniref:Uncharacterized protein n=1 Tax=Brassica cretica TaxID=69181 RepID=A0A8S9QN29_BRACR|nr:hypothetical protein F2Q69_00011163 [Brassica cretica]
MCEFSNICGMTGDGVLSFIVEAEERRTNLRLREEQDATYRASLEADQARESQRQEEEERLEREAAEAERKRKEEEEAQERAEREAAERETDRVRMRTEKVLPLGDDPEKVPDVAQEIDSYPLSLTSPLAVPRQVLFRYSSFGISVLL